MRQKITYGGDRLGGGKKLQTELNNYYRSTHDLSENIVTSMACGTLVPFMVKPLLRGDVFEIDTDAACLTIPTKGPLFGSFKLQGDFFLCPIRLYQALLHNNPTEIGLKMDKVMLPTITIGSSVLNTNDPKSFGKFSTSSLIKYLGLSGIGRNAAESAPIIMRNFNAVPILAYYDIYKNYYANKQEEHGKVLTIKDISADTINVEYVNGIAFIDETDTITYKNSNFGGDNTKLTIKLVSQNGTTDIKTAAKYVKVDVITPNGTYTTNLIDFINSINPRGAVIGTNAYNDEYIIDITEWQFYYNGNTVQEFAIHKENELPAQTSALNIVDFPLRNIDDMRYKLLSKHELGVPFKLGPNNVDWTFDDGESGDGLPYSSLFTQDTNGKTANAYAMNGLCLKTYLNDIYNIWLNSEWIDGENGVNELTKVQVTDGAFKLNSLIYAEKLFELYNRIVLSDGTYDSWLNVVYEKEDRISHEKPLYLGGFYNEVVFQQIVQSAPADGEPLGTLAGKGQLADKTQGGKIIVKCTEPSFLIGIVSLTPRIYYTQGNEFYMTDIQSIDDFHKPGLDGIGFQDLVGERLTWEDTLLATGEVVHRSKIGKLPAWLEYMTSVDKAFGDLAETEGNGYMILNRNYETDGDGIVDATTYIDPQKYNYAFAYTKLDAQNFWVQCRSKIKARRLMSAKQIPNL